MHMCVGLLKCFLMCLWRNRFYRSPHYRTFVCLSSPEAPPPRIDIQLRPKLNWKWKRHRAYFRWWEIPWRVNYDPYCALLWCTSLTLNYSFDIASYLTRKITFLVTVCVYRLVAKCLFWRFYYYFNFFKIISYYNLYLYYT